MSERPGWLSDPYGRYELRYWDGTRWTEHVATGGTATIDPLGDTTVIPIVTPPTAFSPPTDVAPPPRRRASAFLDSLGPDARRRPAPRLSLAVAGCGGAVAALGIVAAVLGNSESRGRAAVAAVVLLVASYVVRLFVHRQPELASAAVGAGVIGLFALGGSIVGDDTADAWAPLVVGVLFLVAWLLPGLRGRPLILGTGTVLLVLALGIATASGDDGLGDAEDGLLGGVPYGQVFGGQHVVFLLAAAVLLGLVWLLDRAGYHGVATSLVVAALTAAFVGVTAATGELGDVGAAALVFAVGMAVCAVGSHGERRATTWWGAVLATVGLVAFFVAVATPDSFGATAGLLLVSGVLLIAGPAVARTVTAQRRGDGGAAVLPPPTR